MKDRKQSESIALLADFEGQTVAGRTLAQMSFRIDQLIQTKVSAERHRCFEVAQTALTNGLRDINEPRD